MSIRLSSVLLLVGCAPEEPERLERLTRAWAAETAASSSPALTSSAVLGGLASQLCVDRDSDTWTTLDVGAPVPVSGRFNDALGSPRVALVETDDSAAILIVLSGVQLLDRKDAWLRVNTSVSTERFTVDFQALAGDQTNVESIHRLPAFGQAGLEVDPGCAASRSSVRGTALWTDSNEQRHEIGLPADADLGSAVAFELELPYLPISGAMRWSSRIGGQERSVTTEDAVEIRIDEGADDIPTGRWPATVRGPSWSGSAMARIDP